MEENFLNYLLRLKKMMDKHPPVEESVFSVEEATQLLNWINGYVEGGIEALQGKENKP